MFQILEVQTGIPGKSGQIQKKKKSKVDLKQEDRAQVTYIQPEVDNS